MDLLEAFWWWFGLVSALYGVGGTALACLVFGCA